MIQFLELSKLAPEQLARLMKRAETDIQQLFPLAQDVINQIQRGQSVSASLSKADGTAPDTQLTPETLANMSDAEFERLYNEMSSSDNKEKLMQIFGHLLIQH